MNPEASFQSAVIDLAKTYHWRLAHFRPARTDKGWRTAMAGDAGWPDLFLVKGRRAVAIELKAARNKTSPEQDLWLEALRLAGIETYVFRPDCWPEIQRVLSR